VSVLAAGEGVSRYDDDTVGGHGDLAGEPESRRARVEPSVPWSVLPSRYCETRATSPSSVKAVTTANGGGVEGGVLLGEPLRHGFVTDIVTALRDCGRGVNKKW